MLASLIVSMLDNVKVHMHGRYGRAWCWCIAHTYIRTRADHDIAGLAMHVRLAYCLAPMHAWLSWDELPVSITTMPGYGTTRTELREKRGWMRKKRELQVKCVRVESSA